MRDHYEVLGIPRNSTDAEIKKAYRNLAKKYHPDKVAGLEEEFKEISSAYEILSDPEKRANYDQFGFEGNDMGGYNGYGGFEEQFANMFGFGGFEQEPRSNQKRKSPKVVFPFNVTLEDLYNGKTAKFHLERSIECTLCHGKGGKSGSSIKCSDCDGSGHKIKLQQVGNGMFQQVQVSCDTCSGTGKTYKAKDRCKKCKGTRTIQSKKLVELFVEKGMVNQQKIIFKGDADQLPGKEPGDLIIELALQHHKTFICEGSDLKTTVKISLKDALCGFQRYMFQHLDGRNIHVNAKPGQILVKNNTMVIKDEGMPQYKRPFDKGDLYIEFEIEYPTQEQLKNINLKLLSSLLPDLDASKQPKSSGSQYDNCETLEINESKTYFGYTKAEGERYRVLQEEEEEESSFGGMGCQQQ